MLIEVFFLNIFKNKILKIRMLIKIKSLGLGGILNDTHNVKVGVKSILNEY